MVGLDNSYARMCRFDQTTNNTYCACDFRINIHRCDHNELFLNASWITLVLTLFNATFGAVFLYYLVKIKGQPFFLNSTRERGILRPRPLHSFHLLVFTYNIALAFNMICLITESYPRVIWAELGNYLPHGICGSLGIFSVLSLVYSTPSVDSKSEDSLILNKNYLDFIGILFIIHPYITFIPLVVLSGYYSDINDFDNAIRYFKAHYICWIVFAILYIILLSYLYYKLINVINCQIKNIENNYDDVNSMNSDINAWKKAKRNINSSLLSMIGGVFFQTILSATFAVSYKELTIFIDGLNFFYYLCWYVITPCNGFISEIVFLYNTFSPEKKPKWLLTLKSNSQQIQSQTNIDNSII
ncbi:hypothetical protein RclHR1_07260004 [Rhizophagus clarus]|uniref:G-protein coupled receptors family 1 profile domain-containing protein n=1 Tax=Rhizophagus clarus TaxID=94130 RepID=A0A2Z6S238_9GLOM|nr:hypothetical protein RclHR1_07260004 [Rhizophagus clarus]GES93309.1 hypothetical protein GLOIN_2v174752 [Rhizophagus clarus]